VYEVQIQKVQLVKIRYFSKENEIRVAVEILVPACANLLFKCDVHVRVHVHVMHPGQATKPKCLGRRVQHVLCSCATPALCISCTTLEPVDRKGG
jgi:hypothetical protein